MRQITINDWKEPLDSKKPKDLIDRMGDLCYHSMQQCSIYTELALRFLLCLFYFISNKKKT